MSVYQDLINNPQKLTVKKDPREILMHVVSCMCDNRYKLVLRKNDDGDFRLSCAGYALSNFGFKGDVAEECEWKADEGDWRSVFRFINSGYQQIERVSAR